MHIVVLRCQSSEGEGCHSTAQTLVKLGSYENLEALWYA